jgi:hypothetical protein
VGLLLFELVARPSAIQVSRDAKRRGVVGQVVLMPVTDNEYQNSLGLQGDVVIV